ncbi:MAG TPA: hypothetical protein VG148_10440 [Pyrinomonadaceae bacterium]|nr:hypothetical protein [Pyrinomonadaceae bacterium]
MSGTNANIGGAGFDSVAGGLLAEGLLAKGQPAGAVVHRQRAAPVAVNPTITAARTVVLVKHTHTTPARVKITLKTSRHFTRAGTLSRVVTPTSGEIKLFDKGGAEIVFTNSERTFTAKELSVGFDLFAEGVKASGNLDDFTLRLTLAPGPTPVGPPAEVKLTAVELTLDVSPPRTPPAPFAPLPQPPAAKPPANPPPKDKWFGGAVVSVQDAGNNQPRAQLVVRQVKPSGFAGKLVLRQAGVVNDKVTSAVNRAKLFADEVPGPKRKPPAKESPQPNPFVFDAASANSPAGRQFFVEGASASSALRDVAFQLGIQNVENDGDRVALTVVAAPVLAADSPVVVVKKAHLKLKRRLITARASGAFGGTGKLTRSGAGPIRLFDKADGGKEVDLSGAGRTLTANELSNGLQLFAESVLPSGKSEDYQLTLTLVPKPTGGLPVGAPATLKMTAVEVALDVAQKRTAPGVDPPLLSAEDKIKKGRFLRVQDAKFNSARAMLIVRKPKPGDFKGELEVARLKSDTKKQVRLFKGTEEIAAAGQTPLTEPVTLKPADFAAGDVKLFAEGAVKSSTERETGFTLAVKDVEPEADKVLMTVRANVKAKGKLFWNRTWEYNTAPKLPATASIPAVKEFLPGAKVEVRIQRPGAADLTVFQTITTKDGAKVTDPHGAFEIVDLPETPKAALRVLLEYRDAKVVNVQGESDHIAQADFEVKKDKVVFHQFDLDLSKLNEKTVELDFGEVEIKKAKFAEMCDAYKSIWFGHHKLKELTGFDADLCTIRFPATGAVSFQRGAAVVILDGDLKDRDVLLHEYGHFVAAKIGNIPNHPEYLYNDTPKHGRDTKEHYEAAWLEGPATFLACALQNDAIYHDGYDANVTFNLGTDNTTVGPHAEGSIQEAFWRMLKVHKLDFKTGYWKAFTDKSKRAKINNVFEFFDNWKDLKLAGLNLVLESFKRFNMEFGYKYLSGADRFKAVAPPKTFSEAAKEFRTIDELFNHFGTLGGGTLADYKEEFYNRNKFFAGGGAMDTGSSHTNPKVVVNNFYIIPQRFQVKV